MSENSYERLDKKLVALGLVATRSRAQQLINDGKILVNSKVVTKTSYKVSDETIEIQGGSEEVGRGFHKIAGAFKEFNIDVVDKVVADVGASTGGFTQYCLGEGAARVYAIDVGHEQLAQTLIDDDRVVNLEGTNIREVHALDQQVDIVVVDLSFISLNLIWQNLYDIGNEHVEMIVLFKPQFEVGRNGIGKKGIVKSREHVIRAFEEITIQCGAIGFKILGLKPCIIKGRKSGNQEYFMYLNKVGEGVPVEELIKEIGE